MKGILGRKIGMTQVFAKNGKLIPVTVVEIEPNVVTQIKTVATDGYDAIQLGVFDRKEKHATKAMIGHAKKANTAPKRFLKEIRGVNVSDYTLGSTVDVNLFEVGEIVDVTGVSKGKGFEGVIKRHGQSRGPMTHGSRFHRRPGSLGTMLQMRVQKGHHMPGHMGDDTITIKNLMVVSVDLKEHYILVSGNIPGPKKSLVLIKENIKGNTKEDLELAEYETVVDEVIEEIVEETTDVVEEVQTTEENVEIDSKEVVEEKENPTNPDEVIEETVEETTAEETSEPEVDNEGGNV